MNSAGQLKQTRVDVQDCETPSLELLAPTEDKLLTSTNCTKSGLAVQLHIEQETLSIVQEAANPNTNSTGAGRWQKPLTSNARNLPSH